MDEWMEVKVNVSKGYEPIPSANRMGQIKHKPLHTAIYRGFGGHKKQFGTFFFCC